jgi:hypothetical protein
MAFFTELEPEQIVNRIQNAGLLCPKTPFIRLIHPMEVYLPDSCNFIPLSFLIPLQGKECETARRQRSTIFIVKSDCGARRISITVLERSKPWAENICPVAQEYVQTAVRKSNHARQFGLPSDTKFDFRVFVFITSVDPLDVYVCKHGITRFCSKGCDSRTVYAHLTNTFANKKNPGINIELITHIMSDAVLAVCGCVQNNFKDVIQKIHRAILVLVIAGLPYLRERPGRLGNSVWKIHCLQIPGFDVMLDKSLKPIILEVNFRHSLSISAEAERMKKDMLTHALFLVIWKCVPSMKYCHSDQCWHEILAHQSDRNGFIPLKLEKQVVRFGYLK